MPRGLNENYARELLELHTVGVDGGYTQQDVVDVARILTGWGIERPDRGAAFEFHDWAHDRGEKTVLGVRFPAGHDMDEGLRLLGLLASHHATMHHVSHKLCARFVADDPPDGCVDAAVDAWHHSDGDIREVLRAIFRSPDFWAPQTRRAKVKTPLEFLVSAVRATGAVPDTTARLALVVARLGQPLFLQPAPTGYGEIQDDWVNAGALLNRMNVAVALAAGRLPGAAVLHHAMKFLMHSLGIALAGLLALAEAPPAKLGAQTPAAQVSLDGLFNQGKWDEAIAAYRAIIARAPALGVVPSLLVATKPSIAPLLYCRCTPFHSWLWFRTCRPSRGCGCRSS